MAYGPFIICPVTSANLSLTTSHARHSHTASLAFCIFESVQDFPPEGLDGSLCGGQSSPKDLHCSHPYFLQSFLEFPCYHFIFLNSMFLIILFKSQPTSSTLSSFPVCSSFCFYSSPFIACKRAWPKGAVQWTSSDFFGLHRGCIAWSRCPLFFLLIDNVKFQIIFNSRMGNADFFLHFMNFSQLTRIESGCISETGVFHLCGKAWGFKEWKILVVHSRRNYWINNKDIEPMAIFLYRLCHITRKMLIQMLWGHLWSYLIR